MKRELFEKAQDALGSVQDAEYTLEKLSYYTPDHACMMTIGTSCGGGGIKIYLDTEVANKIIAIARDYYEQKKRKHEKEFEEL